MAVSAFYAVTECVSSVLTSLGNTAFQFFQPGNTGGEQQVTADVAPALQQSSSENGKAEVKAQEREPSRYARRDPSVSSVSSYCSTCSRRSHSTRSSSQNSCMSIEILSEVVNNVQNVGSCQTYCERSVRRKALGRTLSDTQQNNLAKRQHSREESRHVDEFDSIDSEEDSDSDQNSQHHCNSRVKTRKNKSQSDVHVEQGRIHLNTQPVCNVVNSKSMSSQPCRCNRSSNNVHTKETNNNVVPVKTSVKRSYPAKRQTTPSSQVSTREYEDSTDSLRPLEKQMRKSANVTDNSVSKRDNMDLMTEQERTDLKYALSLQKQIQKELSQVDRRKGGESAYQLRSNANL